MHENEAGKASKAELLASIRNLDAEERAAGAGRGPDAGSSASGPLQLTAAMRVGGPGGPGGPGLPLTAKLEKTAVVDCRSQYPY